MTEPRSSGRTLVLVGVVMAIALMLALPVRSWLSQRVELDELRDEIAAAQDRVTSLQQDQAAWQDPVFIEEQARLRLNLVRSGEAGLIVLDRTPDQVSGSDTPNTWYERLWRSTDAAAGRRPAEITP